MAEHDCDCGKIKAIFKIDPPNDDYEALINKPKINHVELIGDKSTEDLHIDEDMMDELLSIKNSIEITNTILVVDAMTGQDAVNVSASFDEKVGIDGVIITKLDGDTRGGAALSIKAVTGKPILYAGMGEKLSDLEQFHPDRMANRILGMGDVVTLVEKAQEEFDEKETKKAMNKMMSGKFDLDDMLEQMKKVQKLGSMGGLLKLIPGMPKVSEEQIAAGEKEMRNFEIIINSMTLEERHNPELFKYSRKMRVANGCGKTVADVNRVLKKYDQMKVVMKQMESYKKSGRMPPGGLSGMGGMGGFPGF